MKTAQTIRVQFDKCLRSFTPGKSFVAKLVEEKIKMMMTMIKIKLAVPNIQVQKGIQDIQKINTLE